MNPRNRAFRQWQFGLCIYSNTRARHMRERRMSSAVNVIVITVNVFETNFAGFKNQGDKIYELNYREIKCEIRTKVGDQKCNFA